LDQEKISLADSTAETSASLLRERLRAFQKPMAVRSIGQLANSFLPFIALWMLMVASLHVGYWLTLLLAIPAAGLVVRIFIIQHDCGHGAFFRSRQANDAIGLLCSLVTFTPYANWRRQHAEHHANWNNLDRRESGVDIYSTCLTVEEYQQLSPWRRRLQRLINNPIIKLAILPPLVFLLLYRLPFDTPRSWKKERRSVHLTNLALGLLFLGLGATIGFKETLLVELPIIMLAAIAGVWLFSIQHRFEAAAWLRQSQWTLYDASLKGSSHLELPRILRWFTGNIGFHHIHHLNPHIPNYRLKECQDEVPLLRATPVLTLWQGLKAWRYCLCDEAQGKMVPFPEWQRR
jgi:omega-6 fatty acid desaturase (delta-12 desaturase)